MSRLFTPIRLGGVDCAAGVCDDFPLAQMWAHARTIRLADGPDEVHREAIAKAELKRTLGAGD